MKPTTQKQLIEQKTNKLDAIFAPQTVALIGATERQGSVGRTILWNLISNPFGGTVYPINPGRPNVLGIRSYPNIAAVPEQVDLAVIVTPAPTVPGIIGECVEAKVKGAIVISAGFKEIGEEGAALERQILAQARAGDMRIIGPNCLGVMNPITGLNATFAKGMARPGGVGMISQSGALLTAVLDWSFEGNVGFSAFVSVGSMLDVGWGDLIYYLGDDPRTNAIVIYMESIGDARAFLSAAREVSLAKPVIVIKAGRTEAAAKAAASHTGALTGSDEVLDAAFRRCGVLRVERISDIFNIADVLSKQPRPKGPNLTILTNAGGPGVLATDALILGGGQLTTLSQQTMDELNAKLPGPWSHNNPVDILGDASPQRYADTLEITARDPNSDGLLVILTPQDMTDPTQTAEMLRKVCETPQKKPVLASWMGGADTAAGAAILSRAGIPSFQYPDTAARTFNYMWRFSSNLRSLYETPTFPATTPETMAAQEKVRQMLTTVRGSGRALLTEFESKALLAAYGIPTVETRIARSAEEAVAAAEAIGYPVVLKLHSETITHKTDVGGVQLNLHNAPHVTDAFQRIREGVLALGSAADFLGVTVQPMIDLSGYELIIGSSPDPQFGPILLFGSGGSLVEVFKDRALALPPLTTTLARRMMEETKIYTALKGVRGRAAVNLERLERFMVRFSQLVAEQRWIKEIDINPLLVKPMGGDAATELLALDARVVLYEASQTDAQLPRLAIRPYPTRYMAPFTTENELTVLIRPIRPEDELMMVEFNNTLSENSIYLRYFQVRTLSQRISHDELARVCHIDYDRAMSLVAEYRDPKTEKVRILGLGQLTRQPSDNVAEYAILIADEAQRTGLGTELLRRLLEIARQEGIRRVTADILPENTGMRRVSQKLGLKLHYNMDEGLVEAEIDLPALVAEE